MKPTRLFALSLCLIITAACSSTWDGVKEDWNIASSKAQTQFQNSPLNRTNNTRSPSADLFVESGNCPTMEVVDELSTISQFSDVNAPANYNLISHVKITGAERSCEYSGKTATVDIKLAFTGQSGPKAAPGANSGTYPFFVAVTSPTGDILAKELFSAPVDIGANGSAPHYETLRQIIPIDNEARGPRYKILVGFQLTQDQLVYNRTVIAATQAALKTQDKQATQHKAAANTEGTKPASPFSRFFKSKNAEIKQVNTGEQNILTIDPAPAIQPELRAPQPQEGAPIIITPNQ